MSVSKLFENDKKKPNVLLIITDQERYLQHWPDTFAEEHLPNLCRLRRNGMEFQNYFTNTCMCSPSRATMLTSQFPVQTGVTMTGSPEPRYALPTETVNLATVFRQAGYHVEWHGKWHLGGNPSDYGFHGWQPPDAGNYLTLNETLGGGDPNNDNRFLDELCNFLKKHSTQKEEAKPFLLVASFVNPHDVYVAQYEPALGYTTEDFQRLHVPLPSNWMEDLDANNKPRAQSQMSIPNVTFCNEPQDYVNFYAYLHTVVDKQIGQLLDALDQHGYTDETLILRTADHGEQSLSHCLVEKFFNVYEESIHIPFVVSNPIAFPSPLQTKAIASHIDIVPTFHRLLLLQQSSAFNKPLETHCQFVGNDLTPIWDQQINAEIDDRYSNIHFTYDDIPCRYAPSIVRCIRTQEFKYAVYFTSDGKDADWELYDLKNDPLENHNLAGRSECAKIQSELESRLISIMKEKKTQPTNFKWPPLATEYSRGVSVPNEG